MPAELAPENGRAHVYFGRSAAPRIRWPFSILPVPMAITSPSWGFSLAVSGMMIPPFAVSFSSSLRTRTRSGRGVIFTVISLTSVQSIPKLEQLTLCGSRPTLPAKNLLILLPRHFEVVPLLFMNRVFSLRPLLLIQFHGFRDSKLSFFIDALGINDKPKAISIGRAHKIEGILRILPRRDGLLPHVIAVVPRGIDL